MSFAVKDVAVNNPAMLVAPVIETAPVAVIAAVVSVPLTSMVPFTSIAVAVRSISSVAPSPKTVALIPCTN